MNREIREIRETRQSPQLLSLSSPVSRFPFVAVLRGLAAVLAVLAVVSPAFAQQPRINTFFPIGGKAGTTVEVEVRGSSLAGAEKVISDRPGVTGTVEPGGTKADEKYRPLWQSKCSGCHELRSPANRSMTPAQWAATVERMVKVRNAPLSADETAKVTEFLQGMARAGRVTAQIKIDPDVQPGLYELRVATPRAVSTAAFFEVGSLPEVTGVNGSRETAQAVKLPCVANGTLTGNGERHFFRFAASKGQRLVFNLKGYRYSEASQMFFNPNLRLYDTGGAEIAESHGYYELDPLIDWICPADGDYTLEVRDLLGRGNPGSVYRLAMGAVPYDTVLYPPAAQPKVKSHAVIEGKNLAGVSSCDIAAPDNPGLCTVGTPVGPERIYVTPYPVVREESAAEKPVALPAALSGRIAKAGEVDSFTIQGSGPYEFEAFGARVGSPANPAVELVNAKGGVIARINGENRAVATLEAGQTYTLHVRDAGGQAGYDHVYLVEARPARAAVQAVVRPDCIALRPGMSTAAEVLITRRERVEGDIQVTAENLPPGVTAKPAVIFPDRQTGWVILTAAPTTVAGDQPINFMVTAHGPAGETRSLATPQETWLLNNQPRYTDRTECVLAVGGEPEFTAEITTPGPIKVHPRKGVEVKVRIKRGTGFKGPVTFRIQNLPSGWVAPQETIGPDKSEATLLVRPDGNNPNPFLNRDPKLPPIEAVIEAVADEFPFVIGTAVVQKADNIKDEKDDQP